MEQPSADSRIAVNFAIALSKGRKRRRRHWPTKYMCTLRLEAAEGPWNGWSGFEFEHMHTRERERERENWKSFTVIQETSTKTMLHPHPLRCLFGNQSHIRVKSWRLFQNTFWIHFCVVYTLFPKKCTLFPESGFFWNSLLFFHAVQRMFKHYRADGVDGPQEMERN